MMRRTLMLLIAPVMAVLLAGCGTSQQEDQGNNQSSSQRMSEPTINETLVDRCPESGSTGGQQEEASSGEGSNGKIVFARRIASGADIYVIDVEGTHETRLTRTAPAEVSPGWSPDGEEIAFARNNTGLYVINADGRGLRRLGGATYEGAFLAAPVWSPDGQNIAFVTRGTSSEHDYDALYVVNADGTKQTQLTKTTNSDQAYFEYVEVSLGPPSWSPTGSKIAFSSYTDPPSSSDSSAESANASADAELSGIYLINADGTGLCKLISIRTGVSHVAYPVWSPDGEKIAFFCRTDRGGDALCVINPDGGGRKELTGGTNDPPQQAWSPDGQRIAFINESGDLEVINADGTERRRLANAAAGSSSPTWSPDGEKIAFFCPPGPGASTTDRASYTDLCVINADGTEWTRLVLEVDAAVNNPFASWGSG
jgi:Tol biopolymer transport system component